MSSRIAVVLTVCIGFGLGFAPNARAAKIFELTFDAAAGSNNGDAIYGVVGGTATIRDNGSGSAAVVTTAPTLGGSGYLTTYHPAGAASPYGARITPASSANSLAALFSTAASGQRQLEGGFDFFFRSDTDVDTGEELRFLDNDNRGATTTKGLRIVFQGGNNTGSIGDMRVEIIDSANVNSNGTAISAFQMVADQIYHLGVTFSTDDTSGVTTVRMFGKEGIGAIDTAATIGDGLVGSFTFNMNESVVENGFISGAYDIGNLRVTTQDNGQAFDAFRLYDSVPTEFAAIVPEPSTAAMLLGLAGAGLVGCLRRRRS